MPEYRLLTRRQVCRNLTAAATALFVPSITTKAFAGGVQADRIVVLKSERMLSLLRGASVLATYPIALGRHPVGHKREQGDARTPEGDYQIDAFNPNSRYYRALHISYPNEEDVRRAIAAGRSPGGDIEIHGLPDAWSHYDPVAFFKDWTNGCIAVSNRAMDEIWSRVDVGTAVEILA
ncbi:MAG TPA: L,D-transpeptidase family protein [Stellaceae bacterium]|nr:L,D-transpeptidase family protein [Stellaceae bacterium]